MNSDLAFPFSTDPYGSEQKYQYFYNLIQSQVNKGDQQGYENIKSLLADNQNPAGILNILFKILLNENYKPSRFYNLVFLYWTENQKAKLNYNNPDDDFIGLAARNNRTDIVKELLDAGANPNQHDGNSLQWAARNGNLEMVQMLLNKDADPRLDDFNSLKWAVSNNHTLVVKELLDTIKAKYPNAYSKAVSITKK